jgi:hypothetical protein
MKKSLTRRDFLEQVGVGAAAGMGLSLLARWSAGSGAG